MRLIRWALQRRHDHVWDDIHCMPASCVICGATAR